MSVVLNEREWAEKIIATRQLGNKPTEALKRVARYLYWVEGYRKPEVRRRIEDFLLQCDPNAVLTKWDKVLDAIVKKVDDRPLTDIEGVGITEKELRVINALDNRQPRRLAFTLLCLAKYQNAVRTDSGGWVNNKDKEVMRMANISTTVRKQSQMFHNLRELGLLKFSKRVDNLSIQVCFIDEGGEPVLHIFDFRNLGNQYLLHSGENYFRCRQCGLTIKRKHVASKYCPDCAAEMYIRKSVESVMCHNLADSSRPA